MLGRNVGVYGIVARIGEGGMGEVYRARDSRLKRGVALKVLPASVAPGRYGMNGPARGYDVTKDGQRFFLTQLRRRPPDVITAINVVQNWTEELKRRD